MWIALAQRLRPLPPAAPAYFDDEQEPPCDDTDRGWHASSWALATGADVTELTVAEAKVWFTGASVPS
jgi:hypothetical protein